MGSSIRIRASMQQGLTTVRAIIKHPMHTGFGVDEATGQHIPAHYIKHVYVHLAETLVLKCDWSRAVSRNPYLSFAFTDAKAGDRLRITWEDNKGQSDSLEAVL